MEILLEVPCQRCKPEDTGCGTCGGRKIVLIQRQACACGRVAWFRPGVFTSFKGKRYYSVDGLQMICQGVEPDRCIHCEAKAKNLTVEEEERIFGD
jgi:hypothetical protein